METRKQAHQALIRGRAQSALADLYHNATVTYPRELYGRTDDYFQSWFEYAAHFEIEYIQDGGSTPGNYAATLAHPCNAGRYKSERAQRHYVAKGMRDRDAERNDCGMVTGWRMLEWSAGNKSIAKRMRAIRAKYGAGVNRHNALWERISDYGTLYTFGRGGRTLAPDGLWREDGRGAGCKVDPVELSIAACVELIRIVESFNAHVSSWCKGVPELWREHCEEEDSEARAEKRKASAQKARETRERNYWANRDVVTV